jgi:hypothetical protein
MSRTDGSLTAASIMEVKRDDDGMFVGEIVDMVKP